MNFCLIAIGLNMRKSEIGQYIKGSSIIHELDPRIKLIYCFFVLSSTLINSNWIIIFINICTLIIIIILSQIKVFRFFLHMKSLLLLFTLTFLFQAALTKGDLLFQVGKIMFTKQGVYLGILTIARFSAIYLCSTILTMTTSPMKLTSALESLLFPLSKIKVPINQLSMIITISLRFIPTIIEESENIKCAQRCRGADFESKNFIIRIKSISAVLIPVLAAALQRANELSEAMESRCYDNLSSSINTSELRYKKRDVVFGILLLINLIICFLI